MALKEVLVTFRYLMEAYREDGEGFIISGITVIRQRIMTKLEEG